MTNSPLPLSDEDLSAYLDNEVTPEVRARIDGDPKAQERVRTLGAARDALRSAPIAPLSAETVDSMISTALGELDAAAGSPTATEAPVAPPASLQQRRRGRASQSTWMVAAAVLALVVVGMGLIWSGVQSTESTDTADVAATESDQQTARANESSAGDEDGASDSAPSAADDAEAAFPTPPPVSTEPAQLVDLGEAPDGAALRTSLRDGIPTDAEATTSDALEGTSPDGGPITVGQVDRCAQLLELQVAPDSDLVTVGLATVDGQPHLVYEFALPESDDDGDFLIAAVDPGSCAALITFVR